MQFSYQHLCFVNHRNVGTWSDRGCHVVEDKKKTVECACNHLTNFAILMQVKTFEVSLKNKFFVLLLQKTTFLTVCSV